MLMKTPREQGQLFQLISKEAACRDNTNKPCITLILSNLYYKMYQIPKVECSSTRLVVVFAQSIEARC